MSIPHPSLFSLLPKCILSRGRSMNDRNATPFSMWWLVVWLKDQGRKKGDRRIQGLPCLYFLVLLLFSRKSFFFFRIFLSSCPCSSTDSTLLGELCSLVCMPPCMSFFFSFCLIFVVSRVPCMAYGSSQLKENLSRAIYHSHFGTHTQTHIHTYTHVHTFTFRSCPNNHKKREVKERWTPNGMGEEAN